MEDVLEVYQRPYNPNLPQICRDEQPVQLIKEPRTPLPLEPGKPERYDYEYERNGTTNIFMFSQPLEGWRRASVRAQKTAIDWAEEIRILLEEDFPQSEKIALVCDNLNTHTPASLYKAFEPAHARALVERLEIHFTPKHGSWLNMAEIELSVFTKQCLKPRMPDLSTLTAEAAAWQQKRNTANKTINWQFTTEDARIKLKRLYPQIKEL